MQKSLMYVRGATLIALTSVSGTGLAQQAFEHTTCRAGTSTPIVQTEAVIVFTLDQRGVNNPADGALFAGWTQRCNGVYAVIDGKPSGTGWCKNVEPKTGDWTLIEWVNSDKPGEGNFKFRLGTGKWKGVTGEGTYTQTGQTRPVDAGTYQNCVRVKGTVSVPSN